MFNKIKNLLSITKKQTSENQDILSLESNINSLKLLLAEKEQQIERLQQEIGRIKQNQSQVIANDIDNQQQSLFSDIAPSISQLITQSYLLEVQEKPIQSKDVLTIAKRLIKTLEKYHLHPEGTLSATVPFNPDSHTPLSSHSMINPGDPVSIRFVGIKYKDTLVWKCSVEPSIMENLS